MMPVVIMVVMLPAVTADLAAPTRRSACAFVPGAVGREVAMLAA